MRILTRLGVVVAVLSTFVSIWVSTAGAATPAYTVQTCGLRATYDGSGTYSQTMTASVQMPTAQYLDIGCYDNLGLYSTVTGVNAAAVVDVRLSFQSPRLCTVVHYLLATAEEYSPGTLELGCDDVSYEYNPITGNYDSPYIASRIVVGQPEVDVPDVEVPEVVPAPACTSGSVSEGYVGPVYITSRAESAPSGNRVCLRLADPSTSVAMGGRFEIGGVSGAPASDSNSAACSTTPGNLASELSEVGGEIGDASDPTTHVLWEAGAYVSLGQLWVCVTVTGATGTFNHRLMFSAAGVYPAVAFVPDTSTTTGPAAPNPGSESSQCLAAPGGAKNVVANLDTTAGHLWLDTRSTAVTELCFRIQGGVTAGGRLVANSEMAIVGTDTSMCTVNIVSQTTPVRVEVRRSTSTPPVLCLTVGILKYAVSAGNATVPNVEWRPDTECVGPVRDDRDRGERRRV